MESLVRVTFAALVVVTFYPIQSGEAQGVNKDAAYWQSYVATMKPTDGVKVQLIDGSTLTGRLRSTTTEDMLILRDRAFRLGVEQRIRFDAVKNLSRTHPTRDKSIALAVAGVTAFILGALMGSP